MRFRVSALRGLQLWILACAAVVASATAAAQTWPDKPIRLVVPYPSRWPRHSTNRW
jgi:tripartite-type tricarboxylate transporter receptor subunit TctC